MRFFIRRPFEENLLNLIRKIGYHYVGGNQEKSEYNFVRPLGGGGGYPRFHIYLKIDGSTHSTNSGQAGSPQGSANLVFNLHLDQKKPIYKGTTAHSGEYDGDLVKKEAERIKQLLG